MALQNTPPLRLSEILTEFGDIPPKRLSDYYGAGGLSGSGTLKMSDFFGVSDAPAQTYAWYGIMKIRPGRFAFSDTDSSLRYGVRTDQTLNSDPRPGGGIFLDSYNIKTDETFADFSHSNVAGSTWECFGNSGFNFGNPRPIPESMGSFNASNVTRVEYTLFSGSSTVGNGILGGELTDYGPDVKYSDQYVYKVGHKTNTGPLSSITGMGPILKYCYDNNYDIEFKVIIE